MLEGVQLATIFLVISNIASYAIVLFASNFGRCSVSSCRFSVTDPGKENHTFSVKKNNGHSKFKTGY